MSNKPHKHILIIGGSARPKSYTMKAVTLLKNEFKNHPSYTFEIINAEDLNLALPGKDFEGSSQKMLQEKILNATGILLASPEYHGGISSTTKLIIDNSGSPSAFASKPIALLGVAAGIIGAIKSLEQIRSICAHVGAYVLPRAVSIALVQKVFDENGQCLDPNAEKQIQSALTSLIDYIEKHICPAIAFESIIRQEKK